MQPIIECVPNFSEGRDQNIINQITAEIAAVEGVMLLDVDPGQATNRTVVTFVGAPQPVIEAAYRAMKKAAELIDMSKHHGEHPRFGATDVCPLIPVANISMEETAGYARQLAQRAANELNYPIYLYESAATQPERKNLATVRAGEYEGLAAKLQQPEWKPDFGPATFVPKTGATAIGARDFLIALNFNLNTTSTRRANAVAFDVREAGRVTKTTHPDGSTTEVRTPGTLPGTKAIGWYIDEYGIAQVSMNITSITRTPVHIAFEEVSKSAQARGMRVTGTEIVGLVPLKVLTDAGTYYLQKQQRSTGVADEELIKIAIKSLGLADLKPFNPETKVIEYMLRKPEDSKLVSLSLTAFANETASESPAPGGGSVAAYLGALGASLGAMVANLSSHKRGWDERWNEFGQQATEAVALQKKLLALVDEDTRAFNGIMEAMKLPKASPDEKQTRDKAIDAATRHAIETPLQVMEQSFKTFAVIRSMAQTGNPNSVSDAGVAAICARSAVLGAFLNVKINIATYANAAYKASILERANHILHEAQEMENHILSIVEGAIEG